MAFLLCTIIFIKFVCKNLCGFMQTMYKILLNFKIGTM